MAPDVELLAAAIAELKTNGVVADLVGARIYDRVPEKPKPQPPYISLGPTTSIPDDADCIDAQEIGFQFDVWSVGAGEAYSSAECRRICDGVRRALHNRELVLTANALVTLTHELTRVVRDPDGIHNHGVVQFTAIVETP